MNWKIWLALATIVNVLPYAESDWEREYGELLE
jgi:hypothetical protein